MGFNSGFKGLKHSALCPYSVIILPLECFILLVPRDLILKHSALCPYSVIILPLECFILFSVALRPNAGHGLLIVEVLRSHKTTHHSR